MVEEVFATFGGEEGAGLDEDGVAGAVEFLSVFGILVGGGVDDGGFKVLEEGGSQEGGGEGAVVGFVGGVGVVGKGDGAGGAEEVEEGVDVCFDGVWLGLAGGGGKAAVGVEELAEGGDGGGGFALGDEVEGFPALKFEGVLEFFLVAEGFVFAGEGGLAFDLFALEFKFDVVGGGFGDRAVGGRAFAFVGAHGLSVIRTARA